MKLLLRHAEKEHSHNSIPAENVQLGCKHGEATDRSRARALHQTIVCAQQRHQCHQRHGAGFWIMGEILKGEVLRKYEYALYLE